MTALRLLAPCAVLLVAMAALPRERGAAPVPQDAAASRPATAGSATTRPSEPVVVVTGNEKGFIRPCGCSKPALGGIHRRAHAIAELRATGRKVDVVSCGNLVNETGRQQEIKMETFLLALGEMGYAAFVPGEGEFALGLPILRDLRMMAPFPWVAANVTAPDLGLVPSVVLEGSGVVVVGLLPPLPKSTGVATTPAGDALVAQLKAHPASQMLFIYNGTEADARLLADLIPASRRATCDVLVTGHADAPGVLDRGPDAQRVLVCGSKGRNLALWTPSTGKYEGLRLEEARPGTETVDALLERYRLTVKEEALATKVGRLPTAPKYVGDAKCAECHDDIHPKLKETPHQRAFATLVATHDETDPECVRCHVTGWGMESGWVDEARTPTLKNVNCEACHGPGSDHAETLAKTPAGKVGESTCLKCHDPDNSPRFQFKTYWPKIEHK